MVQLTFGRPAHGWLPVDFQAEDYHLQLDVSDVPVNPLDELCSALINVAHGDSAEVNWHLEPAWYQFYFEPKADLITLTILASKRYGLKSEMEFSVTGTFESLVKPIYKALKSFVTTDYGNNWPAVDFVRIKKLTEVIKSRKW
ncbi:hypothetical protein ACFST9_02110 [Hymenobacter monticola]|uniref:Uncharacterized protein n=1 Tax=Hymenobacter monticola TaxID=1705399 RepID=A0ABY4B296_9BACT|nr:hypothetical protein [Hymenobacter monticola]UOE33244.1 hypothetical protein MTP16_19220 [Hymenobacter monticola]